jgi:nucleotide-binding universal stress UspA family protein
MGAELIVLGFPRRGELTTRLSGRVTLSVLQHAPCPVLMASPIRQASPSAH